jgi:arsenate reductase (glutaredoxin)
VTVLGEHGVDYEAREYFKEAFTRQELESILSRAGRKPSEMVSTRSTPYRKERLADQGLSEDELLERMLSEPRLIRRPILVTDDEVVVGFDRARYESIATELAGKQ